MSIEVRVPGPSLMASGMGGGGDGGPSNRNVRPGQAHEAEDFDIEDFLDASEPITSKKMRNLRRWVRRTSEPFKTRGITSAIVRLVNEDQLTHELEFRPNQRTEFRLRSYPLYIVGALAQMGARRNEHSSTSACNNCQRSNGRFLVCATASDSVGPLFNAYVPQDTSAPSTPLHNPSRRSAAQQPDDNEVAMQDAGPRIDPFNQPKTGFHIRIPVPVGFGFNRVEDLHSLRASMQAFERSLGSVARSIERRQPIDPNVRWFQVYEDPPFEGFGDNNGHSDEGGS
ncbi:MAG: hypothetical protein Q9159_005917 [Coniocarpon cinnabarinum]